MPAALIGYRAEFLKFILEADTEKLTQVLRKLRIARKQFIIECLKDFLIFLRLTECWGQWNLPADTIQVLQSLDKPTTSSCFNLLHCIPLLRAVAKFTLLSYRYGHTDASCH